MDRAERHQGQGTARVRRATVPRDELEIDIQPLNRRGQQGRRAGVNPMGQAEHQAALEHIAGGRVFGPRAVVARRRVLAGGRRVFVGLRPVLAGGHLMLAAGRPGIVFDAQQRVTRCDRPLGGQAPAAQSGALEQ